MGRPAAKPTSKQTHKSQATNASDNAFDWHWSADAKWVRVKKPSSIAIIAVTVAFVTAVGAGLIAFGALPLFGG